MANIPYNVAMNQRAQGTIAPCSLLEILTVTGARGFFSNRPIHAVPVLQSFDEGGIDVPLLGGGTMPVTDPLTTQTPFLPWLMEPPAFKVTCDLVTQTARATLQNLSGDTVYRTNTMSFVKQDIWGALFVFRIYNAACEYATTTQFGTIDDVQVDDYSMNLTLGSWQNYSKIVAPDCQINNNCQNVFGSQQCGSTSSTNCLNSYGNCSQLNRFKGLITQWNNGVFGAAANSGVAQPAPITIYNARRTV